MPPQECWKCPICGLVYVKKEEAESCETRIDRRSIASLKDDWNIKDNLVVIVQNPQKCTSGVVFVSIVGMKRSSIHEHIPILRLSTGNTMDYYEFEDMVKLAGSGFIIGIVRPTVVEWRKIITSMLESIGVEGKFNADLP